MKPIKKIALVNEVAIFIHEQFKEGIVTQEMVRSIFSEKYNLNIDTRYDEIDWRDYILKQALVDTDPHTLQKIHDDFISVKIESDIGNYFDEKYAIEALSDEKFCNLKMYIEECIKCINSNLMISATILLRCCVEDFVNIKLQPKKGQRINLGKKMDELIKMIERNDEDFKFVKDKNIIEDVKSFLHKIRGVGNETVHLNGKKLKDLAGGYDIEHGLKMLCFLSTHTILADKINDLKLQGKSFKLPEREKANDNFAEEVVEDEEIPF